jgi:DNA-binding transcriptional ArsR family regulator
MVLRIVFSGADLGRVRVARRAHPSWELVLSVHNLQARGLPGRYQAWRRSVCAATPPEARRRLNAAAALVPAGSFPDFLTPHVEEADVAAHFEAMLSLPAQDVRADLTRTFSAGRIPYWARETHRAGTLADVVAALQRYHELALRPYWPELHGVVDADRAERTRLLADQGVDGLLGSLHPSIRWRHPVLEADYPVDRTLELNGRGLTVVPAHFCWGAPVTLIDPELPPVLVYPAGGELPGEDHCGDRAQALGRLLGGTRARLLAELAIGASTSGLADRLQISAAAVSQHTGVLRAAGLVTTNRAGPSVHHRLTSLGRDLLGERV